MASLRMANSARRVASRAGVTSHLGHHAARSSSPWALPSCQHRGLLGFTFKQKPSNTQEASTTPESAGAKAVGPAEPIISQDDLFHPLSKSPFPEMREKGERIKKLAYCPVSMDKYGEEEHVEFECPNCGFPTHASEERWAEDDQHAKYWPRIREANEDEHDLRSGRDLTEFFLPGEQAFEEAISMSSWDLLLYTRGFPSVDSERSRRHVSKLLTYPMTIASILHHSSPYTMRGQRLLPEGLRSLIALRQSFDRPLNPSVAQASRPPETVRIFVLGARAESTIPSHVLRQISYFFERVPFHIYFIGPESHVPESARTPENNQVYGVPSYTKIVGPTINMTCIQASYADVHDLLGGFDPYLDVFFAFSPGFGFPSESDRTKVQLEDNWKEAVKMILQTKCALFCTGFSPADVERDVVSLDKVEGIRGEFDWILTPGENVFGSEKWEVAEFDPRVAVRTNWGVWGIRGKRYEVREDVREEQPLLTGQNMGQYR